MAPLRIDQTPPVPAIDICIIGAGIVGLALARELSNAFPSREIVVLEKHGRIGEETSSRNSEVIHAGIYYAPGSIKANSCVRGRELLYRYCEKYQIPHRRIGKLIVAARSEIAALENIQYRARANGVDSLEFLDTNQLHRLEPHVQADVALWSPETGIVDSHGLMTSFLGEAEANGVTLALHTELTGAEPLGSGPGFRLQIQSGPEAMTLDSRVLINCAGLHAVSVATRIAGLLPSSLPEMSFIKGNYMSLTGKSPFVHLIYPVPDPAQRGLGIHATLDMAGQCRFGPDIEPVDNLEYTVDLLRIPLFIKEIQQYYPELEANRLQTAYAGIRPRIKTAGSTVPDFVIQDKDSHGLEGLWQLFGIESPGLTASMALAEHVRDQVRNSAIIGTGTAIL
ncbi:MAG: NAD(P)/FAD-dependent oxidoreductase [Pseudohongiella sp.]|nr:NAD(P)/FAD-dependent oxidoreductase [Pseudohongiella sp.]